jgi:hypothetical protein
MTRKPERIPRPGQKSGNLALAETILEAIKIKAAAGLARNPFTGRAAVTISDEEAARQAAPDESTTQLATLILATRDEAFIDWARKLATAPSREDDRKP